MKSSIERSMQKWQIPEEELSFEWLHWYKSLVKNWKGGKNYIYIHGFWSSCDHLIARKLAKYLFDRGDSFYRLSLRWNGESKWDFNTMTLSTQAEDVKNIVDYILRVDKKQSIIPVCYSMWASSLLAAVQNFSEIQKYFSEYFFLAPSFDFLENRKQKMWERRMEKWKFDWYIETQNEARGTYERIPYSFVEDAESYNLREVFQSLKKSMTIVHGNSDDVVPIEATKDFLTLSKQKIDFHEVKDWHKLVRAFQKIVEVILV